MRLLAAAALAASLSTSALAAPQISALAGRAAAAPRATEDGPVRVAMRKETLPPGGKLNDQHEAGERYLFVVSGRLKVSDVVTGDEQVVEAGRMAAERPGDWHVAQALGADPVVLYVIDRAPTSAPAGAGGGE